jgi:hypothetical protein
MVEAADLGQLEEVALGRRLDGPCFGRILA